MFEVKFTNDLNIVELANKSRHIKTNQLYQHFKGGLYIVEDVSRHSETGEQMVVYRSLKTGELWVRPKDMFMDIKQTNAGYTFRFIERHL